MRQEDYNSKDYTLKITDLENMFSVHQDSQGNSYMNLNETLYLNFNKNDLQTYTLKYPMFWTTISYNVYETTTLAWLLMKVNDVTAEKIFDRIEAGRTIYYPTTEQLRIIVQTIRS